MVIYINNIEKTTVQWEGAIHRSSPKYNRRWWNVMEMRTKISKYFLGPRNSLVERRTDSTTIKSHVYVQVKYSVDNNSWEPRVVHCLLEESYTMNVAETIQTRIDNNKYRRIYRIYVVRLGI